jgi:2-C-methyl-D-erythritol 4-phosphate cytidylyltransferase
MSVVGLVPAGGSGERLGADRPKAFVVFGGRALYEWSVDVLSGVCDRVIVAVPAGHRSSVITPFGSTGGPRETDIVEGGSSRSQSVRNALDAAPEASVVVVQDAARPLVTADLVERCVAAVRDGADGAIAAAPVTDTVKEADGEGRVLRTLDRSVLWAVQTPQVFRADALRGALDVDEPVLAAATDDASLVEAAGGSVTVVEAPRENLKVTTALDLQVAEAILAARC